MLGTICIEDAPVPMTAMRLSVVSKPSGHWAEWNFGPVKASMPGMSGIDGTESGPLALVKTGDMVRVDVPNRSIDMLVSDEELAVRRAAWVAPEPKATRGYNWMLTKHIQQADKGCDFDYLETKFGRTAPEPDIF